MSALYTQHDFDLSPFVALYEVTRACDLLCRHCRACAQTRRHPKELTTEQSKELISQFASFAKRPVLVFTGGDPMKRPDIFELVRHAVDEGLVAAMTPSATPLVTGEALVKLKAAGLTRLAVSVNGSDAEAHDALRGVEGSWRRSFEILADARAAGIPLQINTTITRRNLHQVNEMARLFAAEQIALWSVFFLVPVGRGLAEERIAPHEYEEVFERLFEHSKTQPYSIKTTEAPHYRRYVLMRQGNPQVSPAGLPPDRIQRAPMGVADGRGVMFVSHTGTVYPSGFMPVACGKFPRESVVDIYRNAPVFRALRDVDALHGKCGVCEYRTSCGGSRARAFGATRDILASDPDCVYVPSALREANTCSA